jgi:iron complex outermembrane recepter protein
MKNHFTFSLLLLLHVALVAQPNLAPSAPHANTPPKASLSGIVKDAKTSQPLAGVSIHLPDLKTGTTTDANGHYKLDNLPDGRFLAEASHVGYNSMAEYVNLKGATTLDFSLSLAVTENEGVTVTGVASATRVKEMPISVTIIKRKDLLAAGGTNLIDGIARLGGVAQVSTGPAISKPFIRGLGYNRVVTMSDGVRQEGNQWGDEHGIEIDAYSTEKVEILKGPASLMYGSDALAGVLNIQSNSPVAAGTAEGRLMTDVQSNNRLFGYHGNIAGNGYNGFNWRLYGSAKVASDYKNAADGYVWNSKFRENSVGGYMGINKSWGHTHLQFSRFHQQPGVIEGERDSATGKFLKYAGTPAEAIATQNDFIGNTPAFPYQDIVHTKLTLDNHFSVGKNRLSVVLGQQRNQRREFGDYTKPGEPELFFDLNTTTYNVQYHLHEQNGFKTSVGVNGMRQQNKNKGEEVLIPAYRLLDAGAFIFMQKRFNKFVLSGGARYDHRRIDADAFEEGGTAKFTAFKKNYSNVSGSVGISADVSKEITFKANLSRGFRAPNLAELASNGTHEGTNRYEYGSTALKAETNLQGDLGLLLNTEHFNVTINAFYNQMNNFIFYEKLAAAGGGDSLVNVDGEDLMAFDFNQAKAVLQGVDFTLDFHPHPMDWLHISNTFSVVRGRFDKAIDGTRNLPLIPAPRNRTEVKAQWAYAGDNLKNPYLRFEADMVSAQNNFFSAFNTETFTDAYTLLNMGMGTDLFFNDRVFANVHFSVNNLGDVIYQDHLSRLKYTAVNNVTTRQGVFGMGRNFSIRVLVPLQFHIKQQSK